MPPSTAKRAKATPSLGKLDLAAFREYVRFAGGKSVLQHFRVLDADENGEVRADDLEIDFLSLDVEGAELAVLLATNLSALKVVMIESDGTQPAAEAEIGARLFRAGLLRSRVYVPNSRVYVRPHRRAPNAPHAARPLHSARALFSRLPSALSVPQVRRGLVPRTLTATQHELSAFPSVQDFYASGRRAASLGPGRSRVLRLPHSRAGYCAPTDSARPANCTSSDQGVWRLATPYHPFGSHEQPRRGDATSATDCLARCHRCARCNFVTISLIDGECSWYHHCPSPPETAFARDHRTVRIAKDSRHAAATAAPWQERVEIATSWR